MSARLDRAAGVLVGLAAGDALGAGYEFGPAFDGPVEMKGGGPFGWEPGEWTDDTQMAICIAEQAATGDLDLDALGDRFIAWASEANDIGNQTRTVLSRAVDGSDLPGAAAAHFRQRPNHAAGNGSLMRTGSVALACLGDRDRIAGAAAGISAITHADPLAIDACVLWSLAVAEAVETGEVPDIRKGLDHIPADRRDRWAGFIDDAESSPPGVFTPNGFVVTAFQAAWSSIVHTPAPEDEPARHLRNTLENAVRIGNDTDTVAAIAGTLLGAAWGASAVPPRMARRHARLARLHNRGPQAVGCPIPGGPATRRRRVSRRFLLKASRRGFLTLRGQRLCMDASLRGQPTLPPPTLCSQSVSVQRRLSR